MAVFEEVLTDLNKKSRQPCLVPKRRKKTAKTGSWQSQERGASFRDQSLHLVVRATFTGLGSSASALDTTKLLTMKGDDVWLKILEKCDSHDWLDFW